MTTLLIATRNAHKVGEIRAILSDRYAYLTLKDFPGAPTVNEDAPTFAGNATKKAVELARWLAQSQLRSATLSPQRRKGRGEGWAGQCRDDRGQCVDAPDGPFYVLADDSGLEVDALRGAPGVHSARFAALDATREGNTPDADNNAKLLRLLKDVPMEQRTARFRCVLALTPVAELSARNASPVCAVDELEIQTALFDGACEGRIIFAPSGSGGFGYDPLFVPNGFKESFAELGEATKNQLSHRAKALAKLKPHLDQSA